MIRTFAADHPAVITTAVPNVTKAATGNGRTDTGGVDEPRRGTDDLDEKHIGKVFEEEDSTARRWSCWRPLATPPMRFTTR